MGSRPHKPGKPVVLITGAAGDIGGSLVAALRHHYTPIGLDLADNADGAVSSMCSGVLIVFLSLRRGPIHQHYARWDRLIV